MQFYSAPYAPMHWNILHPGEGGGAVPLQTPKLFGTFWDIAKNVPNNFGIICKLYDLDPQKCTVQFLGLYVLLRSSIRLKCTSTF